MSRLPDRPPPVRLDDLAVPQFTPEVTAVRAMLAAAGADVSLDVDGLVAAARAQTGLHDLGDTTCLDRFRVLTQALDTEGSLSAAGRYMAHVQLLQLLTNRLTIQATLARHPEIHDIPIHAPIVVVGLPRTGTTHLHNLLAADPGLRALPYWESLEPVLAPDARPPADQDDPRRARCDQALAFVNACMPHFVRMHEMTVDHAHEEIQLLAIDGSTMLFETMALLPSWRDAYRAADQTASYAYLRTVLQVLQWARGGTRWVLKSPQHLEQLGPLMRVFPDAIVVFTHRDPASVLASWVTMGAYTARMYQEPPIDLRAYGRYWRARIEDLFRACVRDRALVPASQSLDLRFDDFMADDMAVVRRIYALAGRPFDPAAADAMAAFMTTHPRGVHGTVVYDLAQFGLDRDEVLRACTFYTTRFGLTAESPAE